MNLNKLAVMFSLVSALVLPALCAETNTHKQGKVLNAVSIPQPAAPIQITYCYGILGTRIVDTVSRQTLFAGFRIQNISPKPVKAVRFRFDFETLFGERDLAGSAQIQTVEGHYEAGAKVDLIESIRGLFGIRVGTKSTFEVNYGGSDDNQKMICSVSKVAFEDGTIWSADYDADLKAANGQFKAFTPPRIDRGKLEVPDDGQ